MAFKKVRPHKKVCYFKKNNIKYIDYKDVETLKLSVLIELLSKQPGEQQRLSEVHEPLTKMLLPLSDAPPLFILLLLTLRSDFLRVRES